MLIAAGILIGFSSLMLVGLELGWRWAQKVHPHGTDSNDNGMVAVQGAMFGLMGLLMAFTYSGAAERWERRRELAVEEANDIGTAYLRVDLLPAAAQPALRDAFRRYTDARIAVYHVLPDFAASQAEMAKAAVLQQEIWRLSVAALDGLANDAPALLMIPALNAMIDITTTRSSALATHAPTLVFVLLVVLAL